jgi:hypothetical protein
MTRERERKRERERVGYLREYFAPPSNNDPIMTGTILPDLARVTTGNETPLASAREVKAFAHTYNNNNNNDNNIKNKLY